MKFSLRNIEIRKQMYLAFLAAFLFVGGIIAIGTYSMVLIRDSAREAEATVLEAEKLLHLKAELETARRLMLSMLLETDKKHIDEDLLALKEVTRSADEKISKMLLSGNYQDKEIQEGIFRLKVIWESFKETRDKRIIKAVENGRTEEAVRIAMGEQQKRFDEFSSITERLAKRANEKANLSQGSIKSILGKSIVGFFSMAFAGLVIAVVLIVIFSRDLTRRFNEIMNAIEKFNSGELKINIDSEANDELGIVAGGLNSMFKKLYEDKVAHEQYIKIISWEVQAKEEKNSALKRSEERFRGLVETTSDWVWEIDKDGLYTYASPRILTILGYRPEEIIGQSPFGLMPPEEEKRVRELFNKIVSAKAPFENLENVNLHKDGRRVVLETSGAPFFDVKGNLLGYRGIDRDITLRKQAEEEKMNIQAQLLQSEKLASIGQLAAGVAHEINNPVGFVSSNLNTLSGYTKSLSDILLMYDRMTEAVREERLEEAKTILDEIEKFKVESDIEFAVNDISNIVFESRDGLDRIKSIVRGLKDFSHTAEEDMSASDINQSINNAVKLSWHEIKYTAELEKDLAELPAVICKPQQLTQVFLNIIVNAVQAMPEKGNIWIKTRLENNYAVIEIKDNGTGMPDAVIKRIFDPFFTTKPVGKGTGLGLSIAYGIIKEHKGTITVKSKPGEGTTFIIKLPVSVQLAEAAN
ncbi:MAG: PAS domain S-box protein [Deltaproteobacteria bacterium]|nr:PAS domain S-box protein [Deltaproteobacteria bacterium]